MRIGRLAAAHDGVLSLSQLLSLGLTRSGVESRLQRGHLYRVHRGVYAVGHPRLTTEGERRAALLAYGEEAVLSHRTAADLWGLRPSNVRWTDVTIRSRAGRRRRKGIRLHRGPLPPSEVTHHRNFPVTSPARRLLDIAAGVTPRALERAVDEAERLRLFDRDAIADVLDANRGRPGRARLLQVLAIHRPGSTPTRSTLEERFLRFCRSQRLPQPQLNVPVGPYTADFLWADQRLIVETDGRAARRTAYAFEHDRARDARLAVAGYRVVRYTELRLTREPIVVARELRALLGIR
ncbi:MAG: endonuclease domain-containing protein [Actinomycetota bacterium]|nr:endonuclease domain-containing protein [Actinomycetota bacterium]